MARRPVVRWLLIAVAGLLSCWVLIPSQVPVYDGIGNPDEAYRYVLPPAGYKHTPPPTAGKVTLKARNGHNLAGYCNSHEIGPQISLYLPTGAFTVPTDATSVTVTCAPEAPTSAKPADGTFETNVYRVTATWASPTSSSATDVAGTGSKAPVIQMRAPTAKQPGPRFEHLDGSTWNQQTTQRVGNDNYQGTLSATGDWALVRLGGSAAVPANKDRGVNVGLLVLAGVILVVLVIMGLIRRSRLQARADRKDQPKDPFV